MYYTTHPEKAIYYETDFQPKVIRLEIKGSGIITTTGSGIPWKQDLPLPAREYVLSGGVISQKCFGRRFSVV